MLSNKKRLTTCVPSHSAYFLTVKAGKFLSVFLRNRMHINVPYGTASVLKISPTSLTGSCYPSPMALSAQKDLATLLKSFQCRRYRW